jgi:SWI/SNF-related matrix-associated actin-dependent regulator of chromatin subfamily A member 5
VDEPDTQNESSKHDFIRASSKFIVLQKLVKRLVIGQGKKVLIFSGFDETLSCCEYLLNSFNENGKNFGYVRLDGSTSRARRNLNIHLFTNDPYYKVFLIATRAGGEGITLTAATEVVFMDLDWNPQLTLQAEARAHRIGQTQPVTVYKILTRGTVEEQMMGRLDKKLYLAAKVTGNIGNTTSPVRTTFAEAFQSDSSWTTALIRRGMKSFSQDQVDAEEMLSWDWARIVESFKEPEHHYDDDNSRLDEQKWLEKTERIQTSVLEGVHVPRSPTKRKSDIDVYANMDLADRRIGKNRTVLVDGYHVNKESMKCKEHEAVPTLAGRDPRLADWKPDPKPAIEHQQVSEFVKGKKTTLCLLTSYLLSSACSAPRARNVSRNAPLVLTLFTPDVSTTPQRAARSKPMLSSNRPVLSTSVTAVSRWRRHPAASSSRASLAPRHSARTVSIGRRQPFSATTFRPLKRWASKRPRACTMLSAKGAERRVGG